MIDLPCKQQDDGWDPVLSQMSPFSLVDNLPSSVYFTAVRGSQQDGSIEFAKHNLLFLRPIFLYFDVSCWPLATFLTPDYLERKVCRDRRHAATSLMRQMRAVPGCLLKTAILKMRLEWDWLLVVMMIWSSFDHVLLSFCQGPTQYFNLRFYLIILKTKSR